MTVIAGPELIVDDRLATVLATAPAGHAGARTQYRQLLDLLGRASPDFALPAAAQDRLAELESQLGADERAQIIRALPGSLRHPGLILRLAAQSPMVAAAAIGSARLDDWQWSALAIELPLAARGHLRHRRDLGQRTRAVLGRLGILDLGLPAPGPPEALASDSLESPPAASRQVSPARDGTESPDGIAAILTRIEAFRRNRQSGTRQFDDARPVLAEAAPHLPLGEFAAERHPAPAAIRFTAGPDGRIAHADAPWASLLAGLPIDRADAIAPARCDQGSLRAFAQRRPVRGGRLTIVGAAAVAGAWRIDATPRFAGENGAFAGYDGLIRRPEAQPADAVDTVADRLRQLLHELRTPVNAIQGFAELIQQQLFGPTPHHYRSLAAAIAADSAAVLAGFEEIDRLVRFETGRGEDLAGRSDLAAVLDRVLGQLRPGLAARDVGFLVTAPDALPLALAESAVERLLWRLLAHLGSEAMPGEALALRVAASADEPRLTIALPRAMAARDDEALFAVEPVADGGAPVLGLLGGGFALRLARAEARSAGGDLVREGDRLVVLLPGLTPSADANSADRPVAAARLGGA